MVVIFSFLYSFKFQIYSNSNYNIIESIPTTLTYITPTLPVTLTLTSIFSPLLFLLKYIFFLRKTMPQRAHYRPELISLLLPRYYSSSTWGVVGRSTLAGNGLSGAWFVGYKKQWIYLINDN